MRSSNSKIQGKVNAVNSETPLENGLPPKERLPTIQIDTVPSAPSSPVDLTPPDESFEEPLDESDIQLDLNGTTEQEAENSTEELREFLKTYVEDILSQAMVVAEKKLQFAGVPEDEDDATEVRKVEQEEDSSNRPSCSSTEHFPPPLPEPEVDDSEVRATAERVVKEVIEKASETAQQKLEKDVAGLNFPGLPSIHIDAAPSAPPSPEDDVEVEYPKKRWKFKVEDEDSESGEVKTQPKQQTPGKPAMIRFQEAPEDVQEVATSFVKEIVGKAVAMAEEKTVPTVPFNFEDVNLMKTSGPWYVRAREALITLLRTACFCTPRRTDT